MNTTITQAGGPGCPRRLPERLGVLAAALLAVSSCGASTPGREGVTGVPTSSARLRATSVGETTNDVQVNGDWLRLPLKFQPYRDKVPLDAVMREHINRRGIELTMFWPDFAGEPQAEPHECNPSFNRRAAFEPPTICEGSVLLSLAPPTGMFDHIVYGPPSRDTRLRRVGTAHGLDLYLFRHVFTGGPAPNAALGLPERTFIHFEAVGRPEVRGGCVLNHSFRPPPGNLPASDAEITHAIVEALRARWPAQCKLFDIPHGGRVIGDVSFSAHRLPEWPLIWVRTRALLSTFSE